MKLIGFAASYSPTSEKNTNKHNYFMDGVIKEVISENCCADTCEIRNMRSLFAIADGSKSEAQGGDAAFMCMDMMSDVLGADFQTVYKRYYSEANRIVQSRSFNANGARMHMEIGVLYIYRDRIRAYNFGNISVFHKTENSLKKISGEAPKSINVDKVVKKNGELAVKKKAKMNTPHIGYISEDFAVIPFISEQVRLVGNDCVIMTTESVMSVLSEKEIFEVLNDQTIPLEEKSTAVVRLAIEKNPQGNYTVQIVAKKPPKPVNKLKVGITALAIMVAISVLSVFALPRINDVYERFLQNIIKRMYLIDDRYVIEPWTILEDEEEVQDTQQKTETAAETERNEMDNNANKSPTVNTTPKQSSNPSKTPAAANPTKTPEKTNADEQSDKAENKSEVPTDNANNNIETPTVQEPPKVTDTPAAPETPTVNEKPINPVIPNIEATVDKSINDIINSW